MISRLLKTVFWTGWILAAILIWSKPALAWGGGAHIDASLFLLENLVLLAPFARRIISSHPLAFIYGSIVPDVVVGKRYMRSAESNHTWETGFNILESARSRREESFAMGYLSHLAADTVAHNQFIPDRLLGQFARRRRGHSTQELFFDAALEDNVWKVAKRLELSSFKECDLLLNRHIIKTPLPQAMNWRLFRSSMLVLKMGAWERFIRLVRVLYKHELDSFTAAPYLTSIRKAVFEFVNDPHSAPCLDHCPRGGEVLEQAETLKAAMKMMKKKALLPPEKYHSLVYTFQQWRQEAVILREKVST